MSMHLQPDACQLPARCLAASSQPASQPASVPKLHPSLATVPLTLCTCVLLLLATQVHDALLVSLVCGVHLPPLRLDLLKHLNIPSFTAREGCQDRDCLARKFGKACLGNRLEVKRTSKPASWHFSYGAEKVKLFIEHGKNDRREKKEQYKVDVAFPRGVVSKLWAVHLGVGQQLLTHHLPFEQPRVFVSKPGNAFSDVTFTHYWERLMHDAEGEFDLHYFPPSMARTIFIEHYTSKHGVTPDLIDGAASIMGNSAAQWRATYNPSRKRRLAAMVVAEHRNLVAELQGGGKNVGTQGTKSGGDDDSDT